MAGAVWHQQTKGLATESRSPKLTAPVLYPTTGIDHSGIGDDLAMDPHAVRGRLDDGQLDV